MYLLGARAEERNGYLLPHTGPLDALCSPDTIENPFAAFFRNTIGALSQNQSVQKQKD